MKPKFTAGQLVKMGKFKDSIPKLMMELEQAVAHNVVGRLEMFALMGEYANILLNPSNFDEVQAFGNRILQLETRIPGYLQTVSKEEFYNNIKLDYEINPTNDQ